MALKLETFGSRIARRWFTIVLVASILPLLVAGSVAYHKVSTKLLQRAQSDIRDDAKYIGLTTLENIRRAEQILLSFASDKEVLQKSFGAVLRTLPKIHAPDLSPVESNPLNTPETRLAAVVASDQKPRLIVDQDSAGQARILLGTWSSAFNAPVTAFLNPKELFINPAMLPYGLQVCVSTNNVQIHCVVDSDTANVATGKTLHADWALYLGSTFLSDDWDFAASKDQSLALEAMGSYQRAFLLGVAVIITLIILGSVRVVRRMTGPIEDLRMLSRNLAEGDTSARAKISTNDELEDLGNDFNDMAEKIGQQIALFESLAKYDRSMMEGLGLERVCEGMIENIALAIPGSFSVIVLSPEYSNDQPACYLQEAVASTKFLRGKYQLPKILGADRSFGLLAECDELSQLCCELSEGFRDRQILYAPVSVDGQHKAVVLCGYRRGFTFTIDSVTQLGNLTRRLAVALKSLDREQVLYQRGHYDALTGLPNRQLLTDRLEHELAMAGRDKQRGAVYFLDLDRFKQVNDLAGHAKGDQLLQEVAARLKMLVKPGDTVSRLGGDEFVIVAPRLGSDTEIEEVARSIVAELKNAFEISGNEFFVGASVGVAVFPDDGDNSEQLLKNADSAMYAAKTAGRNGFQFFGTETNERSLYRARVERDLRLAMQGGREFQLFYQPKVDCKSNRIRGVEALIRWKHSELGFISPEQFIPIAEESGLIGQLGLWVLDRAVRDFSRWQKNSPDCAPSSVSINVSQLQLAQSKFVGEFSKIVAKYGVSPESIDIEVTETAIADKHGAGMDALRQLRAAGFTVSIDDFGTGYSSLANLVHTPFDTLKIDRSFILPWAPGNQSEMLIKSIIKLAHGLGKDVVAEGVETVEQFMFLQECGCELSQGYLHSQPLPLEDAIALCEVCNSPSMVKYA